MPKTIQTYYEIHDKNQFKFFLANEVYAENKI